MKEIPLTSALLATRPLPMPVSGSKEQRGTVLVVGGSTETPGAAILAGVAALRAGAGRLRIATVRSVSVAMAVAVPEARLIWLPETEDGAIDPDRASERVSTLAEPCEAVLVGPGLTTGGGADALLPVGSCVSIVLDAGVIAGLSERAEAVRACGGRAVITPHAGEMARLLDIERPVVEADPLAAAREAAKRLGCVVIMKGAQSRIVTPAGEH
jgi:ADP-dependent NAD(P)H-hydrate dehydratase